MANNPSAAPIQPVIMDPVLVNNNISPSSGEQGWALPTVFGQQHSNLADVPVEQLRECLQPMLTGLQQLDPESLLELHRVESGGAPIRNG